MKFQEAFRRFLVSLSSTAGNGEGKLVKSENTAGTGRISGVSTSFVGHIGRNLMHRTSFICRKKISWFR